MRRLIICLTAVSFLLVSGLSAQIAQDDGGLSSSRTTGENSAVTAENPSTSVKGVVRFTGKKPPKQRKITLTSDPVCESLHDGKDFRSESVLVNKDGTLRNVFVWVSKGLDGLFRVEGGGILPGDEAATVKVGALEQSNVKTTEVLVDMIDAQRLFAMRSKLISTAREIDESGAQLMRLG